MCALIPTSQSSLSLSRSLTLSSLVFMSLAVLFPKFLSVHSSSSICSKPDSSADKSEPRRQ